MLIIINHLNLSVIHIYLFIYFTVNLIKEVVVYLNWPGSLISREGAGPGELMTIINYLIFMIMQICHLR